MVSLNRDALTAKILAGARISTDDALELYRWPLEELASLANARRDLAKAKSYGGRGREIVTYIVDRNINYTNVCNVYCKFCAFYRTERDQDHYVLTFEQLHQKLAELSAAGGVQILMQGGHHPKLGFDWYVDLLHHIREKYPHINIHGFSPPEFQHFAETFGMQLREVIARFKEAGLGSIPGGGGEILVDRVRQRISPLKCNSDEWLEVMQIAHELGLNSSATMMFGHVETIQERIEHLERLRDLPDQTGRVGRISPHAGAGAHLSRQYRESSEFMGNAGTANRTGRSALRCKRLWFGNDGRKCGKPGRDIFSYHSRRNRAAYF